MISRIRLIYPAAVCVLIALYFAAPGEQPWFVGVVGVATAAVVGACGWYRATPRRTAWLLIALSIVVVTIGEVAFDLVATGGSSDRYPSVADWLYLCAYPPLAFALLWLGLSRIPSRDWSAVIDTAALTFAGVLIGWITVISPTIDTIHLSDTGKFVLAFGWTGDVLMAAAALRLAIVWFRTPAAGLLVLSILSLFVGDVFYGVDLLDGTWQRGGGADLGILIFFGLVGLAALSPSMGEIGAKREPPHHFGIAQLVMLTLALLAAPAALLVEAALDSVTTPVAIAVASAAIGLLVLARLSVSVSSHLRAVGREGVLRDAARRLGLAMTEDDVTASLSIALTTMTGGSGSTVRLVDLNHQPMTPQAAARAIAGEVVDGAVTPDIDEPGRGRPAGPPASPRPATQHPPPWAAGPGIQRVPDEDPSTLPRWHRRGGHASLRVPVTVGVGESAGSGDDVVRLVIYSAGIGDLLELEDVLVGLADQAAVALQRIDLAARVRDSEREQNVLAYRAAHDALTALANAENFRGELREAAQDAGPGRLTAVLFIDLDDFKSINDTLGHEAGDAVLVAASHRIRACLRQGDLGARLGGDEFAVLLRNLSDEAAAYVVARRLTDALAQPTLIANIPVVGHASIGLALAAEPEDYDALLGRADAALYAAKAAGKGRWRSYDPGMRSPLRHGSDLRADLEQALRYRPGDQPETPLGLTMHYQPIMELSSNRIEGFEALIRWEHPELGTIKVPDLIALAEQTGLILPLGEWVLARAFADGRELIGDGSRYVSVNVSVAQMRLEGFMQRIRDHMTRSGLDPSCAVIEITESQLVHHDEEIWADLAKLRRTGVRVAIDDYGTGYASLSYLRHPVVDFVKLDKQFLIDIDTDRNRMLVRAVLSLTNDLRLPLIAEGIEDEPTRSVLLDLGFEYGQGHLFARAMPLDEAVRWSPPSANGSGTGI